MPTDATTRWARPSPVADTYMFVVASWSGIIGLDLAPWPNVQKFVARVAARPRVQDVLKREGLLN